MERPSKSPFFDTKIQILRHKDPIYIIFDRLNIVNYQKP